MNCRSIPSIVALLLLFAISCSGSSGGPISGELDQDINPQAASNPELATGRAIPGDPSGAYLWGIWDILIDPDHAMAYYNRGVVHYLLEEYEQAIADLESFFRLAPPDDEFRAQAEEHIEEMQGQQ